MTDVLDRDALYDAPRVTQETLAVRTIDGVASTTFTVAAFLGVNVWVVAQSGHSDIANGIFWITAALFLVMLGAGVGRVLRRLGSVR